MRSSLLEICMEWDFLYENANPTRMWDSMTMEREWSRLWEWQLKWEWKQCSLEWNGKNPLLPWAVATVMWYDPVSIYSYNYKIIIIVIIILHNLLKLSISLCIIRHCKDWRHWLLSLTVAIIIGWPASLVIDWTPEGGCRRLGRPKRTWRDTFMEDMRAMGVSGSGTHDEIRSVASDRARWRQLVAKCPSRDRRT